jgi:hypothetical protein
MKNILITLVFLLIPLAAFAQDQSRAKEKTTFEIGEGTRFFGLFKKNQPACCQKNNGVKQCVKKANQKYGNVKCRDNTFSLTCRCTITSSGAIDESLIPTAKPTVKPTARPTIRPTARPTSRPTARPTARPTDRPTAAPSCCKHCSKGQPCGDSCISQSYTCHKGRGCAC